MSNQIVKESGTKVVYSLSCTDERNLNTQFSIFNHCYK